MGSGASASRAFALAGRTMRVDSPAQNKFAKTKSPKRVGKDEERPMDFDLSPKQKEWLDRVQSFMAKHVRPAVPLYDEQDRSGERWKVIPVLEDLKKKAKAEGLWNMFMPPNEHEDDEFRGAGLTNLEYALLSEQIGHISWASEVFNCSAPDTSDAVGCGAHRSPGLRKSSIVPRPTPATWKCSCATAPRSRSANGCAR